MEVNLDWIPDLGIFNKIKSVCSSHIWHQVDDKIWHQIYKNQCDRPLPDLPWHCSPGGQATIKPAGTVQHEGALLAGLGPRGHVFKMVQETEAGGEHARAP